MSRARDLSKLGNPNIIKADENSVGFGTQVAGNHANADSSLISAGIITATAYYGDGSNLEGVASAGLGTAVDDTKDSIGQNIYFTNAELSINENTTVNAPDTSSIAYTQYQQVTVESGSELIIADGDSFIPDVLGIGTALQASTAGAGNGLFGTVYTDNIENVAGRGGPNFPLGITVAGVSTLGGNVSIGGTLTYEDVTNVDSIGVVTARNGIDITGGDLNAASNLILKTAGNEKVRIATDGNISIGGMDVNAFSNYRTLTIGGAGASDGSGIDLEKSDGTIYGRIFADTNGLQIASPASGDYIRFETQTSERLRIGSAGQIGIGGANYGTSGQVLTSGGGSAAPQWASVSATPVRDAWYQTNAATGNWTSSTVWPKDNGSAALMSRKTGFPTVAGQQMSLDTATGYWTFPATGTWEISWQCHFYTNNNGTITVQFDESTDSGSSWTNQGSMNSYTGQSGGYLRVHHFNTTVNITNITTYRFKINFEDQTSSNSSIYGGQPTWIMFTKLT